MELESAVGKASGNRGGTRLRLASGVAVPSHPVP